MFIIWHSTQVIKPLHTWSSAEQRIYRISSIRMRVLLVSSELLAGVVFEGVFYSRARSIPFSLSVTKFFSRHNNFFSKHNNFKFKGFIIMFSFFVTVAEGAEGPSSGFEVL